MKTPLPATGLEKVLDHLRRSLPPPVDVTDSQLLERFLANRDETAFAALVQRHGRLVWGVGRRVLGHVHDCEDVFQAVFFLLARKARSVLKREALGSWLYTVAYRTALEARTAKNRRQKREVQMADLPHPEVQPEYARDWQPLLDRELNLLPKKYRCLVVLCDLEGRTRKEAARQFGLKEGTVSSRLATARRMLAARLSRYGLALSGGALAASLTESTASATVPVSLVWSTAKAATLVAAGQCAGVSASAVVLMKGALKTMLLAKLRTLMGASIVAAALGLGGLAYQAEVLSGVRAADGAKPLSEVEALRKENTLLKLNLEVTLEKIQAQEAELNRLRGPTAKDKPPRGVTYSADGKLLSTTDSKPTDLNVPRQPLDNGRQGKYPGRPWDRDSGHTDSSSPTAPLGGADELKNPRRPSDEATDLRGVLGANDSASVAEQVKAALKAWQDAKDPVARKKAADLLEQALQRMKEQAGPAKDESRKQ
jgi:RNA polymerase sigma factor (sigma-70 family)